MKKSNWLMCLMILLGTVSSLVQAQDQPGVIRKKAWDFDRSVLEWYQWAKPDQAKEENFLQAVSGWAEYDFQVAESGWYELWQVGVPPEWTRDIFLDGKLIARLHVSDSQLDVRDTKNRKEWLAKEFNLYLEAGKHSLRFRRLGFPGCMPSIWELVKASDPFGSINAKIKGNNVLRVGEGINLSVTAGMPDQASSYEFIVKDEKTEKLTPVGKLGFPASKTPVTKELSIKFPAQGIYSILAKNGEGVCRPADLNCGKVIAIDVKNPPAPSKDLQRKLIIDIDCTADMKDKFWEKDGKTKVVNAPFGKYRESSGNASNDHWALDGFSYGFDLPDAEGLYQLVVDYPDDDRRTMGFWINDGSKLNGDCGVPVCGGVETGDRYPLSSKMQTHEAFFFPHNNKGLVVAVLNLTRGCKAAAAKIRIYKVEGNLPAADIKEKRGRMMGFFFEEPGRWRRFFGGQINPHDLEEDMITMERWGQWNRYIGANLMFPTINVYQGNHYPSNILEGYFNTPYDECRLNALVAEKYGSKYIPEFHLSGQKWFEKHVMGIWMSEVVNRKWEKKQGIQRDKKDPKPTVMFRDDAARETVLYNNEGNFKCSWKPFIYNALHPKIQDMYISVFGELADRLGDTESFAGISSRLMLSWQWMGWNALPGLKWGYGDWTIAQFEKDTGIKVPGVAGDPKRFAQRYQFLTGPKRNEWIRWRCTRMLDFYRRLRDRIQQAKPDAKLILTWHGPGDRDVLSPEQMEQLEECGICWQDFVKEKGILIIPGVMYGRRYSTPVADADHQDKILDDDFKTLCRLGDRGVMLYSNYFEVNKNLKWEELGGNPKFAAFDCCVPGGINERELYALALADSDCSFIANGGNGWIFGTPKVMTPFIEEYRALPAKQFTQSESFKDPVAVWTLQEKDDFYFYTVNRLPVPVKVNLELAGAGKVTLAASGEELGKGWLGPGNTISFELPPYMLKSFKASGSKVSVKSVSPEVDPNEIKALEPMVAFARKLLDDLKKRRIAVELTQKQAGEVINLTEQAIKSFDRKQYWKVKACLSRAAMVRLYDMIGEYPPGLHERKVPRSLVEYPQAPKLVSSGEKDIIGDVRGRLASINDLCYDDTGNLFVSSPEQVMQFSPEGKYVRSYRLTLPHNPDEGGIRHAALPAPGYLEAESIQILDGKKLLACFYTQPVYVYDLKDSRLIPQVNGNGMQMPGDRHRQLARDSQGNIYVGCYGPKSACGVWKYNKAGEPAFEFKTKIGQKTYRLTDVTPGDLSVDSKGNVYVAQDRENTIFIFSPTGELINQVDNLELYHGVGSLAVTKDGKWLFAASHKGGELCQLKRNAEGKYEQVGKKEGGKGSEIMALLVTPDDQALLIGYETPIKGAAVTKRPITDLGLGTLQTLIPGLIEENNCLVGFTQMKKYQDKLYFLNGNKLMSIVPGSDQAKLVHDFAGLTAKIQSFAIAPNGDIYLSSNFGLLGHSRGSNVYLAEKTADGWKKPYMVNDGKPLHDNVYLEPTDLEVDKDGNLYIRHIPDDEKNYNSLYVFSWSPETKKMTEFCNMGNHSHLSPKSYGLYCDDQNGRFYVASGGNRAVACYDMKGKLLWRTAFEIAQGPGSVPIRNPVGICPDSQGFVWVTDPATNRILCFDKTGKFMKSYGYFGTIDDRDNESFCFPAGIATAKDAQGREWLYVADVKNQRIHRFQIQH